MCPARSPPREMRTGYHHETADLAVCGYVAQLASATGTEITPLLEQTVTRAQRFSPLGQPHRESHDHEIARGWGSTRSTWPSPGPTSCGESVPHSHRSGRRQSLRWRGDSFPQQFPKMLLVYRNPETAACPLADLSTDLDLAGERDDGGA